jgi:hypothetical protein
LCLCVVLSCVGRGLYDGLITRPKESYQMSNIDYETSGVRRPRSLQGMWSPWWWIELKHDCDVDNDDHVGFWVIEPIIMMSLSTVQIVWDFKFSRRPDDGGSTHLWNVGRQSFYRAVHPRRQFWTTVQIALYSRYMPTEVDAAHIQL